MMRQSRMVKLTKEAKKYFAEAGKQGGKKAAKRMSKKEKIERARIAGQASARARKKK